MKQVIKHLISFILPITVLILVPFWIESNILVKHRLTFFPGIILMCLGLFVMARTISTFIQIGKGTLAPWNPTKKLVTSGMYRYVRNPMIIGVLMVLTGESLAIQSLRICIWMLVFFLLNNAYFTIFEEPNLAKRFGDEYRNYKNNVPRWIPRQKPYQSDSEPE